MKGFVFGALVVLLAAVPVRAGDLQQTASKPVDARWLPWLGCWVPSDRSSPYDTQVCVTPQGENGVRVLARSGDRTVREETIVADGTEQRVEEPSCRGTRRAEWSADGQRVFTNGQLSCENEATRNVSGITALTAGAEWIDVQVVTAGGRESVRVRRYRRSTRLRDPGLIDPELEALANSHALGTRLTIDHVIEASRKVTPRALEALLFETKATFPLDSRQLIKLDEAAVEDTVIDLMVAFSFPKKFEVRRSAAGGGFSSFGADWTSLDAMGFGWSALGWGVYADYPWFGYGHPVYSFYSPFAYTGWNYWNGDYYYPGNVTGGDSGTTTPPATHGRVINGSGYTQVVTRAPDEGVAGPRARGTDASSGGFDGGSSGASSGGSSGGSSGVSSGGYSSGGGGDTGRTAVPR